MKYLLVLYGDAAAESAMTDAQRRTIVDEHVRFGRLLADREALVVGEALDSPTTARTVRFAAGGDPMITDGPFLETKEALGGFYVLECADMDAAVELATQVPRSPGLVAEVRPIVDM